MALRVFPSQLPYPVGLVAPFPRCLPCPSAPSLRGNVSRIKCCALSKEDENDRSQLGTSAAATAALAASPTTLQPAAHLIAEFYGLINKRDPQAASELVADDCVYEDLVFGEPFVGKEAILGLFKTFTDGMGPDLAFVIDDITVGDADAAGLTWHVGWKGKSFPFSKGCSFCRCKIIDGKRKITYVRDIVESPLKPGYASLVAIKGVIGLLERFPQLSKGW